MGMARWVVAVRPANEGGYCKYPGNEPPISSVEEGLDPPVPVTVQDQRRAVNLGVSYALMR